MIDRRKTELYRHYDGLDRLLYVGVSSSALIRYLKGHRTYAVWADRSVKITIERFDTREEALEAELHAIRTENPIHNGISLLYSYWADPGADERIAVEEACRFLGLDPETESDRVEALEYLRREFGVPKHRRES